MGSPNIYHASKRITQAGGARTVPLNATCPLCGRRCSRRPCGLDPCVRLVPMTESDLPYNRSLTDLESLLARVKRPGDFCRHGALALPMPMVQVDGVGSLSFPLLE